jgi:hypothetical protein
VKGNIFWNMYTLGTALHFSLCRNMQRSVQCNIYILLKRNW